MLSVRRESSPAEELPEDARESTNPDEGPGAHLLNQANWTTLSSVAAASDSPAVVGILRNLIRHCPSLWLTTICSTHRRMAP